MPGTNVAKKNKKATDFVMALEYRIEDSRIDPTSKSGFGGVGAPERLRAGTVPDAEHSRVMNHQH